MWPTLVSKTAKEQNRTVNSEDTVCWDTFGLVSAALVENFYTDQATKFCFDFDFRLYFRRNVVI